MNKENLLTIGRTLSNSPVGELVLTVTDMEPSGIIVNGHSLLLTHSLTGLLTHSLTHSYSLTHPLLLTHSPTHSYSLTIS